ncbi:phosphoenolpyruvate--protein phosphotransferase [Cryptosporangium arvum]|uniref:phosphoenolpyruvate--protein phosphotransferase n=1 Tax=Cryptosporangium arvum TaxID=80871 RepID=UPI0004B05931|nr:phosphoenolpyruvate--protein phosphotransferase [Cryptosporangium arvum]
MRDSAVGVAAGDGGGQTVGIVVVSHSRALAEAAVRLAGEMAQGAPVRIGIAAGLDEETFGTDAVAIADSITEISGAAGVVVLMDLGSALLSAEMALELLDDEVRDGVVLSPAPLVEGLVGAVVAAAGGADRASVAAEAASGLIPKSDHLAPSPASEPSASGLGAGEPLAGVFVVTDPQGLHARPAAALVGVVRQVGVPVELRNRTTGAGPVPAESLSRVATLGALAGHEVEVRVPPGEPAALTRILTAAAEIFAAFTPVSDGTTSPVAVPPAGEVSSGAVVPQAGAAAVAGGTATAGSGALAASPGVVVGVVRRSGTRAVVPAPRTGPVDAATEQQRLEHALTAVTTEVTAVRDRAAAEVGATEAAIFDAHLLLLDDPALRSAAATRITSGADAGAAWSEAISAAEAEWRALPDAYLRARAEDLAALRVQVLTALATPPAPNRAIEGTGEVAGGSSAGGDEGAAAVFVGDGLTPVDAVRIEAAGVVLAHGSPTAHSVLLLRARGVPAVVAAGESVLDLADGTPIAFDGSTGELVVDPAPDVVERFVAARDEAARRRRVADAGAHRSAHTTDGVRIQVGANLAGLDDATAAAAAGADLAGLVRTEFLFLGRSTPPDVDEQTETYRALAGALGGRRLTLRTLDVGGDKPLPYAPVPASENPFLGVRGLRFSLLRPDLFAAQLTAIVRVAHETPVTVMFPMVSTVDELAAARTALDDAVRTERRGAPPGLEVAAMVEVPSAALKAAALAPLVDEFSIGTNDLTQYTLAAARGDEGVAALGNPWDPGVLRLIDAVGRAAGTHTRVSVCGEFASEPGAAAVLIGLGVRELSVAPALVPMVKQAVRETDAADAAQAAAAALKASTATEAGGYFSPSTRA